MSSWLHVYTYLFKGHSNRPWCSATAVLGKQFAIVHHVTKTVSQELSHSKGESMPVQNTTYLRCLVDLIGTKKLKPTYLKGMQNVLDTLSLFFLL